MMTYLLITITQQYIPTSKRSIHNKYMRLLVLYIRLLALISRYLVGLAIYFITY